MTSNEKKKILDMLAEGKISSDEALNLLNALGGDLREEARKKRRAKTLKVKVFKADCEEPEVDIGVPLNVARWAMKFIPKDADFTINDQDFDFGEIRGRIIPLQVFCLRAALSPPFFYCTLSTDLI